MTEFGDPGKPEEFEWLRAYSPLHNIPNVSKYPAMLLLTGRVLKNVGENVFSKSGNHHSCLVLKMV